MVFNWNFLAICSYERRKTKLLYKGLTKTNQLNKQIEFQAIRQLNQLLRSLAQKQLSQWTQLLRKHMEGDLLKYAAVELFLVQLIVTV